MKIKNNLKIGMVFAIYIGERGKKGAVV